MDQHGIDLSQLIGGDTSLRRTALRGGGEYHGPCPFCGGNDRFVVWPEQGNWWCRGCGRNGDAIGYVMQRDNLNFRDACQQLGIALPDDTPQSRSEYRVKTMLHQEVKRQTPDGPSRSVVGEEKTWACFAPGWQAKAAAFASACEEALYESAGKAGRDYLTGRGLNDVTWGRFGLGYNARSRTEFWGEKEVYLPAGIVIPWVYAGEFWKINIRRLEANADPKYLQVGGGANGLYNAHEVKPDKSVVIVEGEFDAMAIRQAAPEVAPVATGSRVGSRLNRWLARVAQACEYIVAYDDDEAGQESARWWLALLPGARLLVPKPHDPNDLLKLGGAEAVRQWLGL